MELALELRQSGPMSRFLKPCHAAFTSSKFSCMFMFIDKERCLQNIDPKKLVTEQHIQPDPMHEELKTKAERSG